CWKQFGDHNSKLEKSDDFGQGVSTVKVKAGAPGSPRSERTRSEYAFTSQRLLVSLGDLFPLSRFVAFFDRFLFGDVLTLLGLAVKARAFLVIDMRLGVDPHEAVSSACCGCRFSDRLGRRCASRGRSTGSGRAS